MPTSSHSATPRPPFMGLTLADALNMAPAMLWHIDSAYGEITFCNEHRLTGQSDALRLMLKDPRHAASIAHPEDLDACTTALRSIRALHPVSLLFRARDDDGEWRWLVMLGHPVPETAGNYVGLLACCDGLATTLLGRGGEVPLAQSIELLDTPVLLVEFASRKVAAANSAARNLLGYATPDEFPPLDMLLGSAGTPYRNSIFEQLIFKASWRGTLPLQDAQGRALACSLHLRPLAREGHNYLWMSIAPVASAPAPFTRFDSGMAAAAEALQLAIDTRSALEAMLTHQPEAMQAEGLMLSRIYPEEDRVEVTGVGTPFAGMEDKASYPYVGSIAENLVQYGLGHLVVEETTRSIRPIDWVLFIPRNVHSYYAEPWFENGKLRYVLIYCSTAPAAFPPGGVPACRDMLARLADTLKRLEGNAP